nr:hypothetical protein [Saprospiraceae bacterium]
MLNKLIFFIAFLSITSSTLFYYIYKDEFIHKIKKEEDAENDKQLASLERLRMDSLRMADPATGKIPVERLIDAKRYKDQLINSGERALSIDWIERGPTNVAGRT